jgi:pilus assembly protein CpaE
MDIAKSLSYPPEKTIIILNLTGRKADVKREEIEEILKIKIFGRIPADENLALSCLNEGVPIILKKPGHAISVSFREIAKEIVKVLQQNQVEYSNKTRTASAEELLKSSKLG